MSELYSNFIWSFLFGLLRQQWVNAEARSLRNENVRLLFGHRFVAVAVAAAAFVIVVAVFLRNLVRVC